MDTLVVVVVLMLAAVAMVGLGERLRLPWPALMVVLAVVAGLVPGWHDVTVDPELILPLFLPPLLFAAAQRTSWAVFRSRWRAVVGLALALTVVTIAAAAATVWALVPGVALAAAVAIGAAVAPPDPVAVEAVAGPLGIPRRLLRTLQSEGLFNDAVALVVFQAAVAATVSGRDVGPGVVGSFLYGLVVAVGVGMLLAWVVSRLTDRLADVAARNALTLLLPFVAYLAAEQLHASGVIAVVVAALQLSSRRQADDVEVRLTGRAFWDVVELLVTGVAFGLVGSELRVAMDVAGDELPRMLAHAAVVCVVLLAVRTGWMLLAVTAVRRSRDAAGAPRTAREAAVLSWCGMRGPATLALALALPHTLADGTPLPGRTELVLVAGAVIVATLLLPAFTLPVLVRLLGVGPDADAEARAERVVAHRARSAALDHVAGAAGEIESERVRESLAGLEDLLTGGVPSGEPEPDAAETADPAARAARLLERRRAATDATDLYVGALDAARAEVLRARAEPGVDPEAADRVLRQLDLQVAPLRSARRHR